MDPKAISKAKARLRVAEKAIADLRKCKSHEEFSDIWYTFLGAAKNVYTKLEQGAKASPQSRQWFGGKKTFRKSDELLQYLFQARDDDEHGIGEVLALQPGARFIGVAKPGFSNRMSLHISTDSKGAATLHSAESHDGKPILIETVGPHTVLTAVTGRGNVQYPPPTTHLGIALADNKPIPVAELALTYLTSLVADAEKQPNTP
jgi:hypothetical protein